MNRAIFWILLFVEFLCIWLATNIIFRNGWLIALLLVGGNLLFTKLCYRRFLKWFALPEADTSAVQNAALAVTAAETGLFMVLRIGLYYAI